MTQTSAGARPILLAFSGGLDTSFCVPWLAETYGRPIVTLTVDTGGIDAAAARVLEERSRALGAVAHHLVDARQAYFDQVIRFLIMGNVRRGGLYPLCVGAERVLQAQTVAQWARQLGRMVGVTVPLYSCEHLYIVTEKMEGVPRDLPVMRDPDGYIYFKEEVGGLLMGGFEPDATPWLQSAQHRGGIPENFEFQLLPDNWDAFQVLMDNALHRVHASMRNPQTQQNNQLQNNRRTI
jgi:hypothetical protein